VGRPACSGCGGNGYVKDGQSCDVCGSSAEDARKAFEIQVALRRPVKMNTAEGVDGPLPPDWETQRPMTAEEAGFSPAAIAAQNAKDLEAMRREGMGK